MLKIKNVVLLLVVALSNALCSNAQKSHYLDSLVNLLRQQKNDSSKLHTYQLINDSLVYTNAKKDIDFLLEATQLAHELGDTKTEAFYTKVTGYCYSATGNYDKALQYYLRSLPLFKARNDFRNLADANGHLAYIYFDSRSIDTTYIGKAVQYADAAINISNQYLKDTTILFQFYILKAQIMDESQRYDAALQYMAIVRRYIEANTQSSDKSEDYYLYYNQTGLIYKHKGQTGTAIKYYDSAINRLESVPDQAEMATRYAALYNNIASAFVVQRNYPQAIGYFNKSLEYARKVDYLDAVMSNYKDMADMYRQMNDYKAQAEYLQKYYSLNDSLFTIDKKVNMVELETNYELEKKDASLARQAANTAIQRNQRNIFGMIAIGVTAVLLLLLAYRRNRNIREKNKLIQSFSRQLIDSREQEQNRLAHEMHDGIGQELMLIHNSLETYKDSKHATMLADSIENIRTISRNLFPALLESIGLKIALEQLLHQIDNQYDLFVTSEINYERPLDKYTDLQLFRITQEALNNTLKYANARSVKVKLQQTEAYLLLEIKDNGNGFDIEETMKRANGIGLMSMQQRAAAINASFQIESSLKKGTTITLKLLQK